ncbi:alpha/beta fold hydrolase [Kribbella sp. NPDC049174]|uniref:alpha/beta fold hydrolase n=1 Tax=Kribbella sp. NPDC049174 TaxID=3364112 RepID=UPI003714ED16
MTFQEAYDALLERWDVPVEQLTIDGTHVNACGPLDAPPVILLAGHGATSPVWFSVAPRLAEQHRVYAIDLLGDAGRSTGTPPRTIDDLMTWLTGVLDGLRVDRPQLVGHSYGAWIALTYTLRNPARVGRLALIDPTDCFTGLRLPYIARALPSLLRPSRQRSLSFLRWETQGLPVDEQWLELAALAAEEPTAPVVRTKRPTDDQLRSLQPPLLVVVAGRTKSHDPDHLTRRVTALIPTATVVRLDTATHHSLPALHADEVVKALSA